MNNRDMLNGLGRGDINKGRQTLDLAMLADGLGLRDEAIMLLKQAYAAFDKATSKLDAGKDGRPTV